MSDARGRLLTDDELADLKRRADEVAADHFGPGMVELCVEELDALLAHARALAERVAALEAGIRDAIGALSMTDANLDLWDDDDIGPVLMRLDALVDVAGVSAERSE